MMKKLTTLLAIVMFLSGTFLMACTTTEKTKRTKRANVKFIAPTEQTEQITINTVGVYPFSGSERYAYEAESLFVNQLIKLRKLNILDQFKTAAIMRNLEIDDQSFRVKFGDPEYRNKTQIEKTLGEGLTLDAVFVGRVEWYELILGPDDISVSIQLIHIKTGSILWANTSHCNTLKYCVNRLVKEFIEDFDLETGREKN